MVNYHEFINNWIIVNQNYQRAINVYAYFHCDMEYTRMAGALRHARFKNGLICNMCGRIFALENS